MEKPKKPWEELGISPVEYARLYKEIEQEVDKQARIASMRRFKDKPGQFAGLGYIGWLIIVAMCFFVGYLLAQ